jgi:aminopeptidase
MAWTSCTFDRDGFAMISETGTGTGRGRARFATERRQALAGYVPSHEHLERYAELLVGYALGGGNGIAPGEVVQVVSTECGKPLYVELCRAVWRAGGHVIGRYMPDDADSYNPTRDFFQIADEDQLTFLPQRYLRALLDDTDHLAYVRCAGDPHALQDVDPAKMLLHRRARKPVSEWQDAKESAGRFTWTVGLYGTEAMAREADLTLEQYWRQIIDACFLDDPDPKSRWREVDEQIARYAEQLNSLPIDRLHVVGEDVDLWIALGEDRRWIGGGGRNIPSFEVFTSPDWRGTEGWIRFNEPLYAYGTLIRGIELEFHAGRVISAKAQENEALLSEMVATEHADRVGEFSMTDARLSRITHFMADTLFDENIGGPFGNTHIALGDSLHQCYDGDPAPVPQEEWERLGFNDSATHTDIVSTSDRTVTAVLRDGSERTIYASGRFALDED